jgi:hypothetical protein
VVCPIAVPVARGIGGSRRTVVMGIIVGRAIKA